MSAPDVLPSSTSWFVDRTASDEDGCAEADCVLVADLVMTFGSLNASLLCGVSSFSTRGQDYHCEPSGVLAMNIGITPGGLFQTSSAFDGSAQTQSALSVTRCDQDREGKMVAQDC